MHKFGTALDNLLLIKTEAKELSEESYISATTIKDARYSIKNIKTRKSTAKLLLDAMRVIVARRIKELEDGLAKLEAAYEEEYGSVNV